MTEHIERTSIETAEHYVWGEVCDGWHLVKSSSLRVIQERVPVGASEVKHYHSKAHQFFYVLSGVATLEFNHQKISFGMGQGVHVPPEVPHRFINASLEEVVFLVVSTPSTAGDRVNL
jgi:mannose-6-phosphate isomerase-like protein (cupin superfamily)